MWCNCVINFTVLLCIIFVHMFYRVMKGIYQFSANLLSYIPTKYYWNRSTSHLVIAKSKRVNFFETQCRLDWNLSTLEILIRARTTLGRNYCHKRSGFTRWWRCPVSFNSFVRLSVACNTYYWRRRGLIASALRATFTCLKSWQLVGLSRQRSRDKMWMSTGLKHRVGARRGLGGTQYPH